MAKPLYQQSLLEEDTLLPPQEQVESGANAQILDAERSKEALNSWFMSLYNQVEKQPGVDPAIRFKKILSLIVSIDIRVQPWSSLLRENRINFEEVNALVESADYLNELDSGEIEAADIEDYIEEMKQVFPQVSMNHYSGWSRLLHALQHFAKLMARENQTKQPIPESPSASTRTRKALLGMIQRFGTDKSLHSMGPLARFDSSFVDLIVSEALENAPGFISALVDREPGINQSSMERYVVDLLVQECELKIARSLNKLVRDCKRDIKKNTSLRTIEEVDFVDTADGKTVYDSAPEIAHMAQSVMLKQADRESLYSAVRMWFSRELRAIREKGRARARHQREHTYLGPQRPSALIGGVPVSSRTERIIRRMPDGSRRIIHLSAGDNERGRTYWPGKGVLGHLGSLVHPNDLGLRDTPMGGPVTKTRMPPETPLADQKNPDDD